MSAVGGGGDNGEVVEATKSIDTMDPFDPDCFVGVYFKEVAEYSDITNGLLVAAQGDENGGAGDAPNASRDVIDICYTPKFRDCYDHMAVLMARDERTRRSLVATCEAISQNPANYSVWHFRRLCLAAVDAGFDDELAFCSKMLLRVHKNYQIWHHRRNSIGDMFIDRLRDGRRPDVDADALIAFADAELRYLADEVFANDAKNFHCWQYRQWFLSNITTALRSTLNASVDLVKAVWTRELDYVAELIEFDHFNNSAWNQRRFVVLQLHALTGNGAHTATNVKVQPLRQDTAMDDGEVTYCVDWLAKEARNESAWNYLEAYVDDGRRGRYPQASRLVTRLVFGQTVDDLPTNIAEIDTSACDNPFAMHYVLKWIEERATNSGEAATPLQRIVDDVTEGLASKVDPMRAEYWRYRRNEILQSFHKETVSP